LQTQHPSSTVPRVLDLGTATCVQVAMVALLFLAWLHI